MIGSAAARSASESRLAVGYWGSQGQASQLASNGGSVVLMSTKLGICSLVETEMLVKAYMHLPHAVVEQLPSGEDWYAAIPAGSVVAFSAAHLHRSVAVGDDVATRS